MRSYSIAPDAYRDLDAILDYSVDKSPAYADSLLGKMTRQFESLVSQPMRGRSRNRLNKGLRSIIEYPYVIFYRPSDDRIEIVRIIHGARKITSKLFRQGEKR